MGVKFGRDRRVLVLANSQKKDFTKPERPRDKNRKLLDDVFSRKMSMDIYNKKLDVYTDQQSKVYSMI